MQVMALKILLSGDGNPSLESSHTQKFKVVQLNILDHASPGILTNDSANYLAPP